MCRLKAWQVLVAGKPELDLELELHSSSTEDYEVWVARAVAEMSFVGWVVVMPSLRRSLASGQKMKPPIFPPRRNLIPRTQIYWGRWGGNDILPVLAMCKFWFSLAQEMHDVKDVRKYDVMSDKDGGKYVLWLRKLCASTGLLRKIRPYKCHSEENYHVFEKEE